MQVYSFDLEFKYDDTQTPYFASFSFIVDNIPVNGISCGISSRFAGDMRPSSLDADSTYPKQTPNRLALFGKLGLNADCVYGLKQIHSHTVIEVDRSNPPLISADGMICNDREIALSVIVADCLPVYLYDTESGAFGLAHSGWKGTGIVLEALRLMQERFSARPEAVAAILGPCIDSCCYKVDAARAKSFEKEFGETSVRKSGEDFYIDLKAANIRLLKNAGVRDIAVCGNCTFTDKRLGSFRREGHKDYTHMAALVWVS